jgi:hypothetical protein
MSKIKKLILKPGEFFRDFFIKKYPINYKNNVQPLFSENLSNKYFTSKTNEENYFHINFPIDVVYTWVDLSIEQTEKFLKKYDLGEYEKKKNDFSRFKNHNELKYSLRSLEQNTPWVRKIFIVTNGQIPSWLNLNSSKINIVKHNQILESKYLPTFNSHVIESAIHKIQDLSENYIYMNDDVLITKQLKPSYFFYANGLAKIFITNTTIPNMIGLNSEPTQIASMNCNNLLKKYFSSLLINPINLFAHTFHPQLRSINFEIEEIFKKEIDEMRFSKFRSSKDLNVATFLHHYFSYLKGKSILNQTDCMYFNVASKSADTYYRSILARKNTAHQVSSICLNNTQFNNNSIENYEESLAIFLDKLFEDKSSFES